MSHIYISHAFRDVDALLHVHEALRSGGVPDWYLTADARTPEERREADQAIDGAFAMIVLVSGETMRSRDVRREIERAKARALKIIPYQVDKARLHGFFKQDIGPILKLAATMPDALPRLVTEAQDAYRRKCPVVAVMNLKGGVGKTTVSSQVFGTWQTCVGGRVLLVDLDPQYNLTQTFYPMEIADESAAVDRSVISLFEKSRLHVKDGPTPAEDWDRIFTEPFAPLPREKFVHDLFGEAGPSGRLDLISGQFEISKYAFATDAGALERIKSNFLRMIDYYRSEYDLIVFDTNPNATFLTRCALEAADRVFAPMHADLYSLRGVRLLAQVIREHVSEDKRPGLSVVFNAVGRNEQSSFEADARNGKFDAAAGFKLSEALLTNALPRSGHLRVPAPDGSQPPWRQLVIHSSRGGGLQRIRENLTAVATELSRHLD